MAAFDSRLSQIVIRIVYDGAVMAGKTTNLVELAKFFTRARRSELITPEATQDRTLFFDYIQLEGGLIAGHHFRCELWTIPGQRALLQRRNFLLQRADIAVLVVDSRPSGIEAAQRMLEAHYIEEGVLRVPLVLQANKQDCRDALSPAEVRDALGLPASVMAVAAIADKGEGVRDTTLFAMRRAAENLQPVIVEQGTKALSMELEPPEEIYRHMQRLSLDATANELELPTASTSNSQAPSDYLPALGESQLKPVLPIPDSPELTLWPKPEGRNLLAQVPLQDAVAQEVNTPPPMLADDTHRAHVYYAGDYTLHTSTSRHFLGREAGELQVEHIAQRMAELAHFEPPGYFLALQGGRSGYWLWNIHPTRRSLRVEMADAFAHRAHAALSRWLRLYASSSVELLTLTRSRDYPLNSSPGDFTHDDGQVYYLSDPVEQPPPDHSVAHHWLLQAEAYAQAVDAVERYLGELEDQIATHLTQADVAGFELLIDVQMYETPSDVIQSFKERLEHALLRCPE